MLSDQSVRWPGEVQSWLPYPEMHSQSQIRETDTGEIKDMLQSLFSISIPPQKNEMFTFSWNCFSGQRTIKFSGHHLIFFLFLHPFALAFGALKNLKLNVCVNSKNKSIATCDCSMQTRILWQAYLSTRNTRLMTCFILSSHCLFNSSAIILLDVLDILKCSILMKPNDFNHRLSRLKSTQ